MENNTLKDNPLVSVAIITFNQKHFLKECLESILAQSYKNIEIVVADDCSSDGTQDMLREYNEKYPGKFTLCLADKNQGITANSNLANDACKGDYIAWMGGDDLMLPEKISTQVAFMQKNPEVSICYHDLEVFKSQTNKRMHLLSEVAKPHSGGIDKLIRFGCFIGAASAMVRNSDDLPSFDVRLPIASDWLYWIRCLGKNGKVQYISKVLGRYRRHANNITSSYKSVENSALQDHFITCAILKSEYPKLISIIRKRESDLLFQCTMYETKQKLDYKLASFTNMYNLKNLYRLLFR